MPQQRFEDTGSTAGFEAEKKEHLAKQKEEDRKESKKIEEEKKNAPKPGKK